MVWHLSSAVASIIFVRVNREEHGQRLFRTQRDGYTDVENNDKNNANNSKNGCEYMEVIYLNCG